MKKVYNNRITSGDVSYTSQSTSPPSSFKESFLVSLRFNPSMSKTSETHSSVNAQKTAFGPKFFKFCGKAWCKYLTGDLPDSPGLRRPPGSLKMEFLTCNSNRCGCLNNSTWCNKVVSRQQDIISNIWSVNGNIDENITLWQINHQIIWRNLMIWGICVTSR